MMNVKLLQKTLFMICVFWVAFQGCKKSGNAREKQKEPGPVVSKFNINNSLVTPSLNHERMGQL